MPFERSTDLVEREILIFSEWRRADLLSPRLCSVEMVRKGMSRVLVGANYFGNPRLALRVHAFAYALLYGSSANLE